MAGVDPISADKLRETLVRAVRRSCPHWLAEQREDLVQKACVRIIKKCEEKELARVGASYLWKVAHSVVMDEIRCSRRHPEVDLENPGISEPISHAPSPERSQGASEMREAINEGLRQMKEPRRWAVLLYLYGFSLQDSARMLGWNAKRVDNQRYQGLAELRDSLKQQGYRP